MAITKVTNSLVSVNAIHGTLIADNAITSVHIAQNQVTSVQIPDSSITSTQLAANSVDTAELISGSIDAIHLASDSVTTAKILDANVTTAKIANNAITSALIPDGSITDTQLGSGAFTMGNITTTGAIRGPASLTIDPATVGDNTGTVVIAGNLQVDGTTTTVNSTTLDVADKNITLGKGGSASANNGGGITIDGAAATLLYTHSTTSWDMNRPLNVVSGTAGATVATFEGTYSGSGNVKLASFERSGSAVSAAVTYTDATTDMEFGTTTSHSLSLTTGNTRKLTITNAGDVTIASGIFTTIHDITTVNKFKTTNNNTRAAISMESKDSSGNAVDLRMHALGDGPRGEIFTYTNHPLAFATNNAAPQMTLDTNGYLGIGTGDPDQMIHVAKNANTTHGIKVSNTTTGNGARAQVHLASDSADMFMYATSTSYSGVSSWGDAGVISTSSNTSNGIILNAQAGGIKFQDSTTEIMRVSDGGKVGIGETVPLGKLHVKTADSGGSVNSSGDEFVLENSGSTGITILSGTSGDGNIFFGDSGNNVAGVLQYSNNGDSFRISSTGQLLLQTGGANTRLTIASTNSGDATFTGQINASRGAYVNSIRGLSTTSFTQGSAGSRKLGTFFCGQSGQSILITYIGGQGYNASNAQNGRVHIFFRTSNNSSSQASSDGSSAAFYASGHWWQEGRATIASAVQVKQVSATEYDFYITGASFAGNGSVTAKCDHGSRWQSTMQDSTLSGTYLTLPEENIFKTGINVTGNVGIGTNDPAYKLDVYGTDDITMRIHRPSSALGLNDTCGIGFSQRGDTNTSTSDTRAGIFSTYNGSLHLCTEPGGNLNSNPVDHAALTIEGTDQNIGIGTTSPQNKLHVHEDAVDSRMQFTNNSSGTAYSDGLWVGLDNTQAYLLHRENTPLTFGQTQQKRMTITETGILLLKKASTSVNVAGGYIDGGECIMSLASGGNTYLVRNTSTSTYSFYVGGDGEIHAANTTIASLSDERLKENIKPLETGLDTIMKLKPRRFDWKEGEGSGKKNLAGFIAQEVETVLPDLVGEYLHDELDDAKSVRTGDMIPTLVKAIQELKAEIEGVKK